jgi:hypothetical protein
MPKGFDEEIYQAMMAAKQPADERTRELGALGMSGVGGIMQRGDVTRPVAEMINTNTVPQDADTAAIVQAIMQNQNLLNR